MMRDWERERRRSAWAILIVVVSGCGKRSDEAQYRSVPPAESATTRHRARVKVPSVQRKVALTRKPRTGGIKARLIGFTVRRVATSRMPGRKLMKLRLAVEATQSTRNRITRPRLQGKIRLAEDGVSHQWEIAASAAPPVAFQPGRRIFAKDRGVEVPWRPKEKIRFVKTLPLGDIYLLEGEKHELALTGMIVCGDLAGKELCSEPMEYKVPGDLLKGRRPPKTEPGLVLRADQRLIWDRGRLLWQDRYPSKEPYIIDPGLPLPEVPAPIRLGAGLVEVVVAFESITYSFERPKQIEKGRKVVRYSVTITPDAGKAKREMDEGLEAIKKEHRKAAGELKSAEAAFAAADQGGDEAARKAAMTKLTAAEKAERMMRAKLERGQRSHARRVGNIGREILRSVGCTSFRLFVDNRLVAPRDARRLSCGRLIDGTPLKLTLKFELQRHEVPYALMFRTADGNRHALVASAKTSRIAVR